MHRANALHAAHNERERQYAQRNQERVDAPRVNLGFCLCIDARERRVLGLFSRRFECLQRRILVTVGLRRGFSDETGLECWVEPGVKVVFTHKFLTLDVILAEGAPLR